MKPVLLATCKVHFVQAKADVDVWQDVTVVAGLDADSAGDVWEKAERAMPADLPGHQDAPPAGASFAPLPRAFDAKVVARLDDGAEAWVYRACKLTLLRAPSLGLTARPDESEEAFRGRVAAAVRTARDLALDKLRAKYKPKADRLADKLRTADQRVAKEQSESSSQTTSSAISIGASVLGALFGGRRGRSTVTSAAAAARSVTQAGKQRADVGRATDARGALEADQAELEAELAAEVKELEAEPPPAIESLELTPRKADTSVARLALWWIGGPPT